MKTETVKIHPSRLDWGSHDAAKGDIREAYSADRISDGKIREPFKWDAHYMVTTSIGGCGNQLEAEAYMLVPIESFSGEPTTYLAKGKDDCWEAARNDPMGFYHGMTVKWGRETFVLSGPHIRFVSDPKATAPELAEQLPLI